MKYTTENLHLASFILARGIQTFLGCKLIHGKWNRVAFQFDDDATNKHGKQAELDYALGRAVDVSRLFGAFNYLKSAMFGKIEEQNEKFGIVY